MNHSWKFSVITENDESQWRDATGVSYHFPKRYVKYLEPGTRVVYYKGRIKDKSYRKRRLSDEPHYFGFATIGRVYPDVSSNKGDQFAEIQDYSQFEIAVSSKINGQFIEVIPDSRASNYWRDGVRPISQEVYSLIQSKAKIASYVGQDTNTLSDQFQGLEESLTSGVEGSRSLRMVATYERDPRLREAAIRLHGTSCSACGFNFAVAYGQHGAGYIQVHHVVPLGETPGERVVNVETDLVVLCANCHVMVHRFRNRTLTLQELQTLVSANRN